MKMCWLISCSKWISRHPTLSVSFCVFFLAIITNPLFEYALSHNTNSIDAGHIFLNELRAFREPSSEWQIGTLIHTNPLKTHIITKCQHIAAIRTSTNTSTATEHKQHTSFNDDDDDDDDKSYFSLSRFRSHSKVKHTLLHVVILKIHLYDFEFLLNCIATVCTGDTTVRMEKHGQRWQYKEYTQKAKLKAWAQHNYMERGRDRDGLRESENESESVILYRCTKCVLWCT